MNIPYTHESIRLTGRWNRGADCATATATGSYIEFAFRGRMALAKFNIVSNAQPRLHLWIQIDGGDMIEANIDSHIRVMAKNEGDHVCRIIYKGGTELDRRWYEPLTGKVSFVGVQTETPIPIAPDERKTIEFVGDSITEGVLIDTDFNSGDVPLSTAVFDVMRCYQDDVCATYAWQTAEALNLRPIFMGYGAVGVTRAGAGDVPAAPKSYPYNFDGSPITHTSADYILINHGANDRANGMERYLQNYEELLDVIRSRNPSSVIISLSAFVGTFHEELGKMIENYNQKHNCHVHYIDSYGWIPAEPLHPLREGHNTVAKNLIPKMREIVK